MYISKDEQELLLQAITALQQLYARIDDSVEEEKQIARAHNTIMQTSPLSNINGLNFFIKGDNIAAADGVRQSERGEDPVSEGFTGFLEFTDKEISKMDKTFSGSFRHKGRRVCYRKRIRGKKSVSYEIRYKKDGYNISVSAVTLGECKQRFLAIVGKGSNISKKATQPVVPDNLDDFAQYYFKTFRARKVSEITLKNDTYRYNKHIKPYFGNMKIKRITSAYCQELFDKIIAGNYPKTATEVFSLLNIILKMAIRHNIITYNPLDVVIVERHQSEHGKALTKDEERQLLEESAGTRYQLIFALALYTGLRPNEYYTARIEGDFIVAQNSKRHNKKIEYKKIPITRMLRYYIERDEITEFNLPRLEYIRDKFNYILDGHKLYDLRTTFYTRCQECGVADVARMEFVGHTLGVLGDTYTDLSDEYLLREGEKLNAWYAPNLPQKN